MPMTPSTLSLIMRAAHLPEANSPTDSRKWMGPNRAHRICVLVSLVMIGVLYTAAQVKRPGGLDFYQYYTGAVVAQAGAWETLYPSSNGEPNTNVGMVEGSFHQPRTVELLAQYGVTEDMPRF